MRWKYLVSVVLLSAPGQIFAQPAPDEPTPGPLPDTTTSGQQADNPSPGPVGPVDGSAAAARESDTGDPALEALLPDGIPELPAPRYPSAVDPVTSAPVPGALPELAAPALDIVAGTLQVSERGTVVTGVFAPFRFGKPVLLLSDMRVAVKGGSSALQPWGFTISTGYSSATEELQLSNDERNEISDACVDKVVDEVPKAAETLARAYNALPPDERDGWEIPLMGTSEEITRSSGETAEEWRKRRHRRREEILNYRREVYTRWNDLDENARNKLKPEAERLAKLSYESDDVFGDCWIDKAVRERMKDAYSNGHAVYLVGGADFFPFVSGPEVSSMPGEPLQEPTPHFVAGWNVGTNLGYFLSRNLRAWLTINYTSKRAKTTTEDLNSRLGVGIDIAYNISKNDIDAEGFQPGFALGSFGAVQHCRNDDGCDEAIAGYSDVFKDPFKVSRIFSAGAYLDIRASSKIQLRLGVPFTFYDLASAPPNSDGGKFAWAIAPTVSLTVASWLLTPTTTF